MIYSCCDGVYSYTSTMNQPRKPTHHAMHFLTGRKKMEFSHMHNSICVIGTADKLCKFK